jgi:galactitol-specific phosphotransferase system IIB component
MIMKWLKRLFKRKKKIYFNEKGKYKLLIINDEAELLHKNLGINDVRVEELTKVCITSFQKNLRVHTALEETISECTHTNEVVFICFIMTEIIKQNEFNNKLYDILKNFNH